MYSHYVREISEEEFSPREISDHMVRSRNARKNASRHRSPSLVGNRVLRLELLGDKPPDRRLRYEFEVQTLRHQPRGLLMAAT